MNNKQQQQEKVSTKPKVVTLSRNGESLVLENRQNVTRSVDPEGDTTIVQSRMVFNQVINTLSTVCGWRIDLVEFDQEDQEQ